ncbi:hypothetical protein DPMN_019688 [Dreissena polymorpha]|uniref:Alpha-mannosidase n=1 Tax=Dreissena polymorpha TaxID=45954 RepID=A0A9D4NIY8_DREPO|nr:hypothetical protein DPMN_019688 [Dreissena polymorpha]
MGRLRNARRDVGMFQHHDEITGTALPFVVSYDEERLTNAFRKAREALAFALSLLLTKGSVLSTTALKHSFDKESPRLLLLLNELKFQYAREDVGHEVVTEEERNIKQYQASEHIHPTHNGLSIVSFSVKLLPYEVISGKEFSLTYKSGFSQKFTMYNAKATSVFITNEIDLNIEPSLVNTEIIMRLQTDVDNGYIFTDQNGFMLMGRRNN